VENGISSQPGVVEKTVDSSDSSKFEKPEPDVVDFAEVEFEPRKCLASELQRPPPQIFKRKANPNRVHSQQREPVTDSRPDGMQSEQYKERQTFEHLWLDLHADRDEWSQGFLFLNDLFD
jgi:hypothetical protein